MHRGYFADPFVLRVDDLFFAYGTGAAPGGRPFEVLQSADLVHWESLGGALDPLEEEWATDYGAPEVASRDGVFHMYYSVGTGDRGHLLRVATASRPEGPFVDADLILTRTSCLQSIPIRFAMTTASGTSSTRTMCSRATGWARRSPSIA